MRWTWALILSLAACSPNVAQSEEQGADSDLRVISTAPSITETLFAIGAGESVIAVSDFCVHPPEAQDLPKMGGLFDPNFELIASLEPDSVIVTADRDELDAELSRFGIESVAVDHDTYRGILDSFEALGQLTGQLEGARALRDRVRLAEATVRGAVAGRERPSILLFWGAPVLEGGSGEFFLAGADGLYGELVEMAGGQLAFGETGTSATLGLEGVLRIDPEVIVDLRTPLDEPDRSKVIEAWNSFDDLRSVRNGQVHVLDCDYALIPGARIDLLLWDLAQILHPDIDWTELQDPSKDR